MESKPSYPSDYRRALGNVPTSEQVDKFLKRPGAPPPLFVFGFLKLPSVLKYVIDADNDFDVVGKMVQATALDHRLYYLDGLDIPTIQPTSEFGQGVDGFLVFGLDAEQRGKIHEFETGMSKLDTVQVEICQRDGELRTFDAGAFVWTAEKVALTRSEYRSWKIDQFVQTEFYDRMVRSVSRNGLA